MEILLDNLLNNFNESGTIEDCRKILISSNAAGLPCIGETLGKPLLKLFPYDTELKAEFSKAIGEESIPSLAQSYTYYNPEIVNSIRDSPFSLVTLTMTTCKRLDLFKKTINSFLNLCTDIDNISRWICVDDNSSEEDREEMKRLYPFFTFVFKNKENKGHPQSMNIIRDMVKTPYIFHLEDDWNFFIKRPYIGDLLNLLISNPKIGQCLLNRNYSERETDIDIKGGFPVSKNGINYLIHEYCPGEKINDFYAKHGGPVRQCAYWPHFSFRPSLLRKEVLDTVGKFDEKVSHFEMEYSHRYVNKGYISAFLDDIVCLHIGRLTSERDDKTKLNAYDLNNEAQLSGKEEKKNEQVDIHMKTFVINLDSRKDRWEKFRENREGDFLNYTRFPAIDGYKLYPSDQLLRIFDGNDYNMRCGMVGCALSHIILAIELTRDPVSNFYFNIEDDAQLASNLKERLSKLIINLYQNYSDWDLVYLGHHLRDEYNTPDHYGDEQPSVEKWDSLTSLTRSLGGTSGYLISKTGAVKLLNFIQRNGMTNGIDTVQQKAADELNIYYIKPHLVYAECFRSDEKKVDSDIQYSYKGLSVPVGDRLIREIKFYTNIGVEMELIDDYGIMKEKMIEDPSSVLIYNGANRLSDLCELARLLNKPHYTVGESLLVYVARPTEEILNGRYFERLSKNGKFNVNDCLIYQS